MKILLYEAMGMTEQEKINIINQAIDEKKPVSFYYKGLDMVEKPFHPDGGRKKSNCVMLILQYWVDLKKVI